jgi:hypothetical protein
MCQLRCTTMLFKENTYGAEQEAKLNKEQKEEWDYG